MTHPDDAAVGSALARRQRADLALAGLAELAIVIAADRPIPAPERDRLVVWMREHAGLGRHRPYGELFDHLHDALGLGVLSAAAREEILDGIAVLGRSYHDAIAAGIRELEAIAAGIAADGRLEDAELGELRDWSEAHARFRRHWPYDGIGGVVAGALAAGRIGRAERERLEACFAAFRIGGVGGAAPIAVSEGEAAVFAIRPEIVFAGRDFCVSGCSARATREQMHRAIAQAGGNPRHAFGPGLHCLVVCDGGDPAWAFSCSALRIAAAVRLQRVGDPVLIIREADLWDALADLGIGVERRAVAPR